MGLENAAYCESADPQRQLQLQGGAVLQGTGPQWFDGSGFGNESQYSLCCVVSMDPVLGCMKQLY